MKNKIKTESEYHAVLLKIEKLMSANTNTPAGEQLDKLVTLIEDYEEDLELVKIVKERLNDSTIEEDINDL